MNASLHQFVQAGQAAQRAVDHAIERAELVRLVRDRGDRVLELCAILRSTRQQLDGAIANHEAARIALDEFDHKGRAPR